VTTRPLALPVLLLLFAGLLSGCTVARPLPGPLAPAAVSVQGETAPADEADEDLAGCQLDLPEELFQGEDSAGLPAALPPTESIPSAFPGDEWSRDHDPGAGVLRIARQFVGVPYRRGGNSPAGFDCSGLVYYAYRELGIAVPRTSAQQHRAAQAVTLDSLRSGDLLFFKVKPQRVSHVGIFVEDDLFLHATSTGKNVTYSRLGESYWKKRLVGAGRFVPD
jgi:murein DD-endopeptidase